VRVRANQTGAVKMRYSIRSVRFLYIVAYACLVASQASYSQPMCLVHSGRVNNIRLGDSIETALHAFQGDFDIVETKPERPSDPMIPQGPHLFTLVGKSNHQKWITFAIEDNRTIIEVDIRGSCKTKEGIGVGSTLGEAIKVYGRPLLDTSDIGYYVGFKRIPWVFFLLNDEDIPKRLRGIADDELAPKEEKEILSHHKARITEIRLLPGQVDK
jgi:hypothetical protein